jgi:hypothetical protein
MNESLNANENRKISQEVAAKHYGIPWSSLILKMKALKENRVMASVHKSVFLEKDSVIQHKTAMLCDTAGSKEPRLSKNVPGKLG